MRVLRLLRVLRGLTALLALAAVLSVSVARADTGFGVVPGSFASGSFLSDGATADTQAGGHPYQAVTSFAFNTSVNAQNDVLSAGGEVRDAVVDLPPGFIGDPNAVPQCPRGDLFYTPGLPQKAETQRSPRECPLDTQVGVATVHVSLTGAGGQGYLASVPVYNIVPSNGEIALFAFNVTAYPITVFIHTRVRTAGDYGLAATASDISQLGVPLTSRLTFWGVPADPRHDGERGEICVQNGNAPAGECGGGGNPSDAPPRPFLTDPTMCNGQPLVSTLRVDSWEDPGQTTVSGEPTLGDPRWLTAAAESPPLLGCEDLVFDPSLEVVPEITDVDTPTGLSVVLHVPQSDNPYGLATPDLRNAAVTLPPGMAISPSAANGLDGCTPEEIGMHTESPVVCPDGSKLGTVRVTSPDLPENASGGQGELTGAVYLGAPASGPITAPPYTIYLVAEGYGVSIRLQGTVSANATTGQLTARFMDNPPLPFDNLRLSLFGGPRAPVMTPPACGAYAATSELIPYSSFIAATPYSSFATSFGGGSCPSVLPFGPSFSAGSTNTTAAGFGSFVVHTARTDGQQALSQITLSPPPGLLGMLSSVALCREPDAAAGTCSAASRIGTATAAAGAGPEPFFASGTVYLTGPYQGAPFGLSVAIPALAGPFDLGTVVVRSAVYVDPQTTRLTVVSNPLPQMLDTSETDSGIPVALQRVSVNIDRPGFIFNPTSCSAMSVNGKLGSNEGASVAVSSPFQVNGCHNLAFKPSVAASTQAKSSKLYGASLNVTVASGPGQANIAKVAVSLPKQLPSRLSTLQKACTEAQFAANPAGCPAGSIVGVATAQTPVLNVPLTGPAILVSHGGAAFPDLVFILQGQGVTVELTGKTEIKRGVTYSRFETVPDAPIAAFDLRLPAGPHSILASNLVAKAHGSMCGQTPMMHTTIVGQNGAVVTGSTRVAITGCSKATLRAKPATQGDGLATKGRV